jgi:DNA-binding transcriptional ArsR family regulator
VSARGDTFRSQIGPYAMVPIWVLKATKEATAVHLYAVLSRYANRERRAWPKHERLADDLGVSERSLRRALKVLRDVGAIVSRPRRRPDGVVDGTEYLLMALPDKRPPVAASGQGWPVAETDPPATGGRSGRPPVAGAYKEEPDPLNQIQEQEERKAPPADALPVPGTVFGAPTLSPSIPAEAFLLAWNEAIVPPLRPVTTLTPKRRRLISARLVERPLVAWASDVFPRIATSSFCLGGKGWVASLDWLIKTPDAAVKVLEGQYDDHIGEAELQEAAAHLSRVSFRTCPHEPRCGSWRECSTVREMALKLRARKAVS